MVSDGRAVLQCLKRQKANWTKGEENQGVLETVSKLSAKK